MENLLSWLAASAPELESTAVSHGDFHFDQLLITDGGVAMVDFDHLCNAPAALDLASYSAHLIRGLPGDIEVAEKALAGLADGYGGMPLGARWYLSACIVRRCMAPFRHQDDGWPERITGMIDAAEASLRL